jgi:hypothetical protein
MHIYAVRHTTQKHMHASHVMKKNMLLLHLVLNFVTLSLSAKL